MQHLFDAVTEKTTYYPKVKTSSKEIEAFRYEVWNRWGIQLDESYLGFLLCIDGFGSNGFNFYGTKRQDDVYVCSAIDENDFWKAEIPDRINVFIVGEADMDFYCFDPRDISYHVIGKVVPTYFQTFSSFSEFLLYALYRYG